MIIYAMRLEDSPAFINAPSEGMRKVHHGEGIYVGYRYFYYKQIEPLFPIGYGLSYTTFEFTDLKVPKRVEQGAEVTVQLTVKNTGVVEGKEVVQIYVTDPVSSLPLQSRELKGFAKVDLQPGKSKTISFTLDQRAFSFFDPQKAKWVAESGNIEKLVGSSSRDIHLKGGSELV
jgi:beta-glucosidase